MTELRPWVGFESLDEGLARLQARALGIRQTLSRESEPPGEIWQTLSAESVRALPAAGQAEDVIVAHLGTSGPSDLTAKEASC